MKSGLTGSFALLLLLSVLLASCASPTLPAPAEPIFTPIVVAPSATAAPPTATASPLHTSTPTPTPIPTRTAALSQTPTAEPSLLLPGMAGFQPTPTYAPDPALAQKPSATPPACPLPDASLPLSQELAERQANRNPFMPNLSEALSDFLNQGGSADTVKKAFASQLGDDFLTYQDMNGDGQAEILLKDASFSILGCGPEKSKYQVWGTYIDGINLIPPQIRANRDLNGDGLPELVLVSRAFGFFSTALYLQVEGWDGEKMGSLLAPQPAYPYRSVAEIVTGQKQRQVEGIIFEAGEVRLDDIDRNGTVEILVVSDVPGHPDLLSNGPWRGGQDIFTWNGRGFALLSSEIDPPVHRFQAVHDADQSALLGEYDRALDLYQDAVFSDKLLGWSQAHFDQQADQVMALMSGMPTPAPLSAAAEEYAHLAAYAHFRILVLHALRGADEPARAVYETLVEKFPPGQPGSAAAELARLFFAEYQSTGEAGAACRAALSQSGEAAREILPWLSSPHHGFQSPAYQVVDLCPFGQQVGARQLGTP
jgi:hypothetical protein